MTMLMLVSCSEKGKDGKLTLEQEIFGEWHSTGLPVNDADIYISFAEDKTFELYQQIGSGAHRLYRGEWEIEGDILTGSYNDGEAWAASYSATISDGVLTMTSKNEASEKSTYKREAIPAEVKDNCVVVVKSAESVNAPLL